LRTPPQRVGRIEEGPLPGNSVEGLPQHAQTPRLRGGGPQRRNHVEDPPQIEDPHSTWGHNRLKLRNPVEDPPQIEGPSQIEKPR